MKNLIKLIKKQENHMNNDYLIEDRKKIHDTWFQENTIDYLRHKLLYESITPLAKEHINDDWLTIGDGRYGLDSIRLKKLFGLKNILPTDISENMLKASKEKGYINNYSVQNSENLTFEDDSFDIIFCKESYHHFPRPAISLYEMIRVARKAIILIEPTFFSSIVSGHNISFKFLLKSIVKKILRKPVSIRNTVFNNQNLSFEDSGNFVFNVNPIEINQIAHGIGLGEVAYIGLNDVYLPNVEFNEANEENSLFIEWKSKLDSLNELSKSDETLYPYSMSATIIFLDPISEYVRSNLLNFGYRIMPRLSNPFL